MSTRCSIFYADGKKTGYLHIYTEMQDGLVHVEYADGATSIDFACSARVGKAVRAEIKRLSRIQTGEEK